MDARYRNVPPRRRGVVLVLILAMLGLLALIGVTFATFSGQAQVGARYVAEGLAFPSSDEVMDFGLLNLINDSDNPTSAIRGHSLKRDMYGNGADKNGYLEVELATGAGLAIAGMPAPVRNATGHVVLVTNIPCGNTAGSTAYIGFDFRGWTLKTIAPGTLTVAQTFKISVDDTTTNAYRTFTLADGPDGGPQLIPPNAGNRFVLDGRYLHAFNGGLQESLASRSDLHPVAQFANFRYNNSLLSGNGGAADLFDFSNGFSAVAMDEDYDAPDLHNWFLALQSADGQVQIPSFHRPSIIRYDPQNVLPAQQVNDWTSLSMEARSKFLRPRKVDHPGSGDSFPDLIADPLTGKITYDVDNDGDGVNDSVWLDLGAPVQRSATGKMYKALYAPMVLGLNGRMPLNTAGNLHERGPGGGNQSGGRPNHTSHLGTSVSEINPRFALQNHFRWDPTDTTATGSDQDRFGGFNSQVDNYPSSASPHTDVSLTQLRNLLVGTRPLINPTQPPDDPSNRAPNTPTAASGDGNPVLVNRVSYFMANGLFDPIAPYVALSGDNSDVRGTAAVAGRYGEPSLIPTQNDSTPALTFNNPVKPGRSLPYNFAVGDAADDDFDTTDFYGVDSMGAKSDPERSNLTDWTGYELLPVERVRAYVTPIDPSGNGVVTRFGQVPISDVPAPPATGGAPNGQGPDAWGRVSYYHYFRPPGKMPGALTGPDLSTNPLHGYEAMRLPLGSLHYQFAAMPYDVAGSNGMDVPTYTNAVNSHQTSIPSTNIFPSGSFAKDLADETNVYAPSRYDALFGPQDLEWLYRQHDVDGASLDSRLKSLAPISFNHPQDGQKRRRMFSLESWETNRYVSANSDVDRGIDGRVVPGRPPLGGPLMTINATPPASGAAVVVNPTAAEQTTGPFYPRPLPAAGRGYGDPTIGFAYGAPKLASNGRRMNLNLPLPAQVADNSTSPPTFACDEAVRRRWILDAYILCRSVLPNASAYSPEECVQLSQFLTNVIDFRDTDCVMTRFVNPEVIEQSGLISATAPATPHLQFVKELPPPSPTYPAAYYAPASSTTFRPVVQWGMEYNPVAINEVLAMQFNYMTGQPSQEFFIELANTLTRDGGGPGRVSSLATDLDLSAWQLTFLPDDPSGRPDPFTGNIPPVAPAPTTPLALTPIAPTPGSRARALEAVDTSPGANRPISVAGSEDVVAGIHATNIYFVAGTPAVAANADAGRPGTNATLASASVFASSPTPVYGKLPQLAANTQAYYWVYLMRPSDPADPASPLAPVDCMRFQMRETSGAVAGTPPNSTPRPGEYPVAWQRLQPNRGGHAIGQVTPSLLPGSAPTIDPRYGLSEQTEQSPTVSGFRGLWQSGSSPDQPTTQFVYHTLGARNGNAEAWDYFAFHDRDFMGVAELLLVPGCPPNLFTKQFVENGALRYQPSPTLYGYAATPGTPNAVRQAPLSPIGVNDPSFGNKLGYATGVTPNQVTSAGAGQATTYDPHAYPYLVDKFFYTDQAISLPPPATSPPHDGWHTMLEYFEVPPTNIGAIGRVAYGENLDWQRQDLRPGLMNLNLIIDEETFFGLIDDQRLNLAAGSPLPTPRVATQSRMDRSTYDGSSPVSLYSYPFNSYIGPNGGPAFTTGFFNPPATGGPGTGTNQAALKGAFLDFLRLTHGGSNTLFSYLDATPFLDNTAALQPSNAVPAPRPYRPLSNPDIQSTILRPAFLPNTAARTVNGVLTTDVSISVTNPGYRIRFPITAPLPGHPTNDRDETLTPIRRLFQIPDAARPTSPSSTLDSYSTASVNPPFYQAVVDPPVYPPTVTNTNHQNLSSTSANLWGLGPASPDTGQFDSHLLGGANTLVSGSTPARGDSRQHPAFRVETLEKVMNLTTTRTHQYAVWFTVGFFEVIAPGNPAAVFQAVPTAAGSIDLAIDQLGQEIGLSTGRNIRYRSFFLVDRTRATGFNSHNPTDFRECVTYRRRIE